LPTESQAGLRPELRRVSKTAVKQLETATSVPTQENATTAAEITKKDGTMARAIKRKTTKPKRKAKPAKPRSKRSAGSAARRASVRTPAEVSTYATPIISRDVIEEILVRSAKSPDGERLSDQALSQVAIAANLDPTKVLEAHGRLSDEADEANFATVFQIVELWNPFA
jgi:hypothetical protein